MTTPTPSLPYDFGLVSDLHGTFSMQLTLTWDNLHLAEMENRLGQFNLFSDPAAQIQFPTPVSPLQAGVLINFVHWTLPRMGPVIVSTAAQGALNYIDTQGWQVSPSLNGDIRLANMQWVSVTVSLQLNMTPDSSWTRFTVEPAATFGLTFNCLFGGGQVCRPRSH
jgi:hypothetical protein